MLSMMVVLRVLQGFHLHLAAEAARAAQITFFFFFLKQT